MKLQVSIAVAMLAVAGQASAADVAMLAQTPPAPASRAHDRDLAEEEAFHAGGGKWVDMDGNPHTDSYLGGVLTRSVQQTLASRYTAAVEITDAWMATSTWAPHKTHLVCGSFRAPGQGRRHFIASIDDANGDEKMSANAADDSTFYASDCRLPRPVILTGTERPVASFIEASAATR